MNGRRDELVDPVLQRLVDLLLDGEADAQSMAQLEDRLRSDADARRYYRRAAELHAGLRWLHRSQSAEVAASSSPPVNGSPTLGGVLGLEPAAGDAATNQPPVQPPLQSPLQAPLLRGMIQVAASTLRGLPPAPVAVGLCVVGLAAIVALPLYLSRSGGDANQNDAAQANSQAAKIQPLTVLRVSSGTTEMAMARIGTVLMHGPTELELLSPTRARLNHGKVRFRIDEPSARGFVVETPHGDVTDLGTEFGVDLSGNEGMEVVVFQGAVDLRVKDRQSARGPLRLERLAQGDGVIIDPRGELRRVMSVVAGDFAEFEPSTDSAPAGYRPVIVDVRDNLRTSDTKKFYEIVPHGMREDALAYVDRREHEWNGLDASGMPQYLIGADYIKPFNNDKGRQDIEVTVTLARPARLFILFDKRLPAPAWLAEQFRNTGDSMGLDCGSIYDENVVQIVYTKRGVGPGNSVEDPVFIWERIVTEPGEVRLGPNGSEPVWSAMYAIAAVPLEPEKKLEPEPKQKP